MYKKLDANNQYVLICCFFIFFINGLYSMAFGSLLPLLSSTYGLNDTVSGLLLSGHQAGNLIAGLVAGILPVYLGRKNSILFLCSFVMLGFFLIIVTGNPYLLVLAFFLTGISRGSISNFNNKTVNDISNSSPVALNFLHSLFAVGALISPFLIVLATNIFGNNGWKIVCAFFIGLIFISQLMFSKMKLEEFSVESVKKVKDYSFFSNKLFWNTVVIVFFYVCVEAALTGWIVKYFIDANILSVKSAQLISSLLWLAILLGRIMCVLFGDRVSKSVLLVVISISTTCFYLLLLNSSAQSMILLSVVGLGFSMGGIYPTAITIAGSSIKEYPMAMGWLLIIGGVGGILMPIVTGIVSDKFGVLMGMATIVLAIVIMLIGVIWFYINEKRMRSVSYEKN